MIITKIITIEKNNKNNVNICVNLKKFIKNYFVGLKRINKKFLVRFF